MGTRFPHIHHLFHYKSTKEAQCYWSNVGETLWACPIRITCTNECWVGYPNMCGNHSTCKMIGVYFKGDSSPVSKVMSAQIFIKDHCVAIVPKSNKKCASREDTIDDIPTLNVQFRPEELIFTLVSCLWIVSIITMLVYILNQQN